MIHQAYSTSSLAIQHSISKEEEWPDKILCRFQKSQQGLSKGRISITKHGFTNRFYSRKCHVFVHGWFQRIQPDQDGTKGCRENCFQNAYGQFLLHCDALRVKKCKRNLSTSNDDHISRYDALGARGLCG